MRMMLMYSAIIVLYVSIWECQVTKAIKLQRFHTQKTTLFHGQQQHIHNQLHSLRGGGRYSDEYDDYDEYDEYDDMRAPPPRQRGPPPPPRRPSPNRPSRGPPTPSRARGPPPPARARGPPPPHRGPPRHRAAPKESILKKTVDLTAKTAASSIKGTGKAAYYLATPKHVTRSDITGVWRFDQQVGPPPDGPFTSCAANVEFTHRGDAITTYEDNKNYTPYKFTEKKWPRSCTIEFTANAFQGPKDDKPVTMFYKGYYRRKMADKNVIKIVGNIYEIEEKGGFWRSGGGGNQKKSRVVSDGKKILVGTFTARRRITASNPPSTRRSPARPSRQMEEEEEYDDYDAYDPYDDYDAYDPYDEDINGYDGEYDYD
mmetsp:Transcript_8094/g.11920  ORF Transcript_8094/g.11920 Transcript_8094/m.11920 type:complete len:372 (+) Transcript_8094:122-1237(+)